MLAVYAKRTPSDATNDDGGEAGLWLDLARRQLDRLRPRAEAEQRDDLKRIGELRADAASLAARADIANDEAARKGFVAQRREILENIVEVYADRPHAAEEVAWARRELGDPPSTTASDTPGTN
jgi:hypothetical protein